MLLVSLFSARKDGFLKVAVDNSSDEHWNLVELMNPSGSNKRGSVGNLPLWLGWADSGYSHIVDGSWFKVFLF